MILLLLFVVCVIILAWNNSLQFSLRDTENADTERYWHFSQALLRGIVIATISALVFGFSFIAFKIWFLTNLLFWLLFDPVLNVFRHKTVFYIGKTDTSDLLIRSIARKVNLSPELTGITLKVILVALTAIIL